MKRSRVGRIAVGAIIVFLIVYTFTPLLWMLMTSLKSDPEAVQVPPTLWPKEPTFDAYKEILIYGDFPRYFLNSTIISLGAALISSLLGGLAGYGFSRFRFKGRAWLMGLILASQMLPGILLVGPYFDLMTRIGLYNTHLGLIIAFTTITLPFSTWMLKGFTDSIPEELDEAAMIDGCGRWRVYFKVLLPLLAPGMVATISFAFLLAWGDLLWALVLTADNEMATVTLGLTRLVTQFRVVWPQLMAGSLVGIVPSLVLYLALERRLVQGLSAGAVKG